MKQEHPIEFQVSQAFSLGVEIELQILDKSDLNLTPKAPEILAMVPAELKERIALTQLENRLPQHSVTIHENAVARKTSSTPKESQPIAIGGTAFQDSQDLLDLRNAPSM